MHLTFQHSLAFFNYKGFRLGKNETHPAMQPKESASFHPNQNLCIRPVRAEMTGAHVLPSY